MNNRNTISSGFVWLPVLLGILVVALLGGAYVYETQKPITPAQNSTISVPGMSKYTDADFGFSFWHPSGWKITQGWGTPYGPNGDQNVKKRVLVKSSQTSDDPIVFSVDIVYSPDGSTPNMVKDAVFDKTSQTMDGLPISNLVAYTNYLIRLNANYYLYVAPEDGTDATPFVKTIVATDSAIATPVSIAEQIKIIQAQKDAYAGQ